MPERSNSAAVATGTNRPGLCIAGPKQSSASRGETTEAVAKQEPDNPPEQQRGVGPFGHVARKSSTWVALGTITGHR